MTAAATPMLSDVPSHRWRDLSARKTDRKLPKGLDAAWDAAVARVLPFLRRGNTYVREARLVLACAAEFEGLTEEDLQQRGAELRATFRRGRETTTDVHRGMAFVREVARRRTGLNAYPEQVAAALALWRGCTAEVATGEGKTLIATMPATLAGWRGRGCHVVTANDYLAARDAEWTAEIYAGCGLTVASVTGETPPDQRGAGYAADITYTTNKEAAADFLRDRLASGKDVSLASALVRQLADGGGTTQRRVMRGLEYAIVDEADSCLIDEAVTPLIISGEGENEEQVAAFTEAADLAAQLDAATDYRVNVSYRDVELTQAGRAKLNELRKGKHGVWSGARRSEELVVQAVSARELFHRDQHYVVQEEKVVIVDEFTGRLMPDRTWRDGLHQAVEAKEGLPIQPPKITLNRVSFQRFFRQYRKLCGMTGTGWEARYELWQTYRMPTVRIPTHKPCIRAVEPARVYAQAEDRWQAVAGEIASAHEAGRPVLIGTRSVAASEHLSELLDERDLRHVVLNAVRHEEEAQIVAGAGQRGAITIATNMAGRGTDIKLGPGVAERGGLHIVMTEQHESRRIDRQLVGRAGRQGDPGSAVLLISIEDELVQRYGMQWLARRLLRPGKDGRVQPGWLARRLVQFAQARAQMRGKSQRAGVLRYDQWLAESLGFAGTE